MRAFNRSPTRHHGLTWLLWLALCLPMAQSLASWHGYSHVQQTVGEHGLDPAAAQAGHCDLCLVAAAVGAAGLTGQSPGWQGGALRHALMPHAVADVWLAQAAPAYQSRAPPPSSN